MKLLARLCALALVVPLASANNCDSIADIAKHNDDLEKLTLALKAADLFETLDDEDGPFTVFAPTDEAFHDLPPGLLDDLLNDKDALTEILLYHVVAGKYKEDDLDDGDKLKTLQGSKVKVSTHPTKINDAKVKIADIKACNGVIHVIDKVLIPPSSEPEKPKIDYVGECSSSHKCGMCEGKRDACIHSSEMLRRQLTSF